MAHATIKLYMAIHQLYGEVLLAFEGPDDTQSPIFQEIVGNDPAQTRIFPGLEIEAVLL